MAIPSIAERRLGEPGDDDEGWPDYGERIDWPTALAIFLPPFAAVLGVAIGARMSRTTQQETLKFEARQRRLERFEASIGETKTLLIDADPKRITMNFNAERSPKLMQDLVTR